MRVVGQFRRLSPPRSVHTEMLEESLKTVAEMLGAGSFRNMVAIALQVDVETVDAAAALWQTGKGCHFPSKDFKFIRELPASKVGNIASDVVRMIDHEKLTLIAVANKLGVTQGLASRAYKQTKGERTQAMAKEGVLAPRPGSPSPISQKLFRCSTAKT